MKQFNQQGFDFLEVDTMDDCSYITVTRNGTPIVLIRDNPDKTSVNVITWPDKEIEVSLNNNPVN